MSKYSTKSKYEICWWNTTLIFLEFKNISLVPIKYSITFWRQYLLTLSTNTCSIPQQIANKMKNKKQFQNPQINF
jgi:hypothetical protein